MSVAYPKRCEVRTVQRTKLRPRLAFFVHATRL